MKSILKNVETVAKIPVPNKENMVSMSVVMNKLAKDGYTTQFKVEDNGLLSFDSETTYRPEDIKINSFYRFEGDSDPSDNSILYAIETKDGEKGTVSDAYGAYSDPLISNFMDQVQAIEKKSHEV